MMPSKQAIIRWIALAFGFAAVLYLTLYIFASRSEGYQFVSQQIHASATVKESIGDVISLRPSFIGGYSEEHLDEHRWISIAVIAKGGRGIATINATADRTSGNWTITGLKVEDVELNETPAR